MIEFCTIFDSNYYPFGKAMIDSLTNHCHLEYVINVLALDENVQSKLATEKNPKINIFLLDDLTKDFHLEALRENGNVNFFYALSSIFTSFIYQEKSPKLTIYVDADIWFLNDVELLISELLSHSISITSHNFNWRTKRNKKYGLYNVGIVAFTNTKEARMALNLWRFNCLNYCKAELYKGKYADQKYLDHWPGLFMDVNILERAGINDAIWNIRYGQIRTKDGKWKSFNEDLIFYHFANLRRLRRGLYSANFSSVFLFPNRQLKQLYASYCNRLEREMTESTVSKSDLVALRSSWIKRTYQKVTGIVDRIYV